MALPLRDTLAAFQVFARLSDEDLHDLLPTLTHRSLGQGDLLFARGDPGDAAYVVVAGTLGVAVKAGGVQVPVACIQVGDIVGDLALVDGSARSATVAASSDCELVRIDAAEFGQLRRAQRPAAYAVLRSLAATLAARQRATNERVSGLLGPANPTPPTLADREEAVGLLGRLAFWRKR